MEENKGQPATIDEYIAQFPPELQQILEHIRAAIHAAAPGAVEKMSYNMPTFDLDGSQIWFSAWKRHIGVYPRTAEMDAAIRGLSDYKGTKGSVHFPLDKPMPYHLIAEMVSFLAAENQKNQAAGQ